MTNRRELGTFQKEVGELLNGLRTARDIAEQLGVTPGAVWSAVNRLGRAGELKRVYELRRTKARHVIYLPKEIDHWLLQETPRDAHPAEMIAAIVMDAFHDAKEARA